MFRRLVIVALLIGLLAGLDVAKADPTKGGVLNFAIGGETANYDCHANYSFAAIHWLSPHYSTLLKFDTANYPKILPGVAESYAVSDDQLIYTFKLRKNVKFHDGTPMTSEDVKATYDRIRKPPKDVISLRSTLFEDVASIDTPDVHTVVFKLSNRDASMLANFASPWNCIYSAAKLKEDQRFPLANVLGTGPFVFVENVKGSHWVGKRFDDYYEPGKPYLDGFRAVLMSSSTMINALLGGRISAEFRSVSPADRNRLVDALGEKLNVQESGWVCKLDILFNVAKPPFNDERVRRALNMALDRWGGAKSLQRMAFLREVGGIIRPGYEFAAGGELLKYPGYSDNIEASRTEARRLLKEAGAENLKITLLNRNLPMPYTPTGLFLIDQWRQVGVNVEHQQFETAPYQASLQAGNYEAAVNAVCDFMDEPNLQLVNYISADRSSLNYGKYIDRTLDELYEKQKRSANKQERFAFIRQFEQRLFEKSYAAPIIWWHRIVVAHKEVKGWNITPSHYLGQDLADIWLAK